MLKSKRKIIQSMQKYQILYEKSNVLKWIQTSLEKINFSLSDNSCQFVINHIVRQNTNSIITVQMYVKPSIGIYKDIEFRPKMYLNSGNLINRPKIYNDRRIYHPNINIQTIQITYPQLCQQWNPAKLQLTLSCLKYVILEPILSFVPNNPYNKETALNYKFQRNQFRNLIIQNGPAYLEDLVYKKNLNKKQSSYQEADQNFLNIESFFPNKISIQQKDQNGYKRNLQRIENDISFLSKQIKKIKVSSDIQNYESQIQNYDIEKQKNQIEIQ